MRKVAHLESPFFFSSPRSTNRGNIKWLLFFIERQLRYISPCRCPVSRGKASRINTCTVAGLHFLFCFFSFIQKIWNSNRRLERSYNSDFFWQEILNFLNRPTLSLEIEMDAHSTLRFQKSIYFLNIKLRSTFFKSANLLVMDFRKNGFRLWTQLENVRRTVMRAPPSGQSFSWSLLSVTVSDDSERHEGWNKKIKGISELPPPSYTQISGNVPLQSNRPKSIKINDIKIEKLKSFPPIVFLMPKVHTIRFSFQITNGT